MSAVGNFLRRAAATESEARRAGAEAEARRAAAEASRAAEAETRRAAAAETARLRSALVSSAQAAAAQVQADAARKNTAPPQPLLRGFRNAPMPNNIRPIVVAPATRGRRPNVRNRGNYQNQIRQIPIRELTSLDVTAANIPRMIQLVTENIDNKTLCELFLSKIHSKLDRSLSNSNDDAILISLSNSLGEIYISLTFQLLERYIEDRKICDLGCSILGLLNQIMFFTQNINKYINSFLTDKRCHLLFRIVELQFDESYYVLSTINIISIYVASYTSVLTESIAISFINSIRKLTPEPKLKRYENIQLGLCNIVYLLRICLAMKNPFVISKFMEINGIHRVWKLKEFVTEGFGAQYVNILFELLCIIASDPERLPLLEAEPDIFTFMKDTILLSKNKITPDIALAITNILLMQTPPQIAFVDDLFRDNKLTIILNTLNNSDEMPLPIFRNLFIVISGLLGKPGVTRLAETYGKLLMIISSIFIASNAEKKEIIRQLILKFYDNILSNVITNPEAAVAMGIKLMHKKIIIEPITDTVIIKYLFNCQLQWDGIPGQSLNSGGMWIKCAIRIKAWKYISQLPKIMGQLLFGLLISSSEEIKLDIPEGYSDVISTDIIKQGDIVVRIENRLDNGTIQPMFLTLDSWNVLFTRLTAAAIRINPQLAPLFGGKTWDQYVNSMNEVRGPDVIDATTGNWIGFPLITRLTGPLTIISPLSVIIGVANPVSGEIPLRMLGGRRRTIRRRTSKRKTRRHR